MKDEGVEPQGATMFPAFLLFILYVWSKMQGMRLKVQDVWRFISLYLCPLSNPCHNWIVIYDQRKWKVQRHQKLNPNPHSVSRSIPPLLLICCRFKPSVWLWKCASHSAEFKDIKEFLTLHKCLFFDFSYIRSKWRIIIQRLVFHSVFSIPPVSHVWLMFSHFIFTKIHNKKG